MLGMTHADDNCAPLAYYVTSCVNFLQTVRDNLSFPYLRGLLTLEDGTNMLYRNVGKKLSSLAA